MIDRNTRLDEINQKGMRTNLEEKKIHRESRKTIYLDLLDQLLL